MQSSTILLVQQNANYHPLNIRKNMNTIMINKTLLSVLIVSFITSTLFAEGNHKHSHADEHWASPDEATKQVNPIKSDKDSIARGAINYATHCVSCHGINAEGDGELATTIKPTPTNLKAMSGGHTDGDFAWKIANGRGAMPAWKNTLNENDIWDLVNFIQSLKNEGASVIDSKHDHKH